MKRNFPPFNKDALARHGIEYVPVHEGCMEHWKCEDVTWISMTLSQPSSRRNSFAAMNSRPIIVTLYYKHPHWQATVRWDPRHLRENLPVLPSIQFFRHFHDAMKWASFLIATMRKEKDSPCRY